MLQELGNYWAMERPAHLLVLDLEGESSWTPLHYIFKILKSILIDAKITVKL